MRVEWYAPLEPEIMEEVALLQPVRLAGAVKTDAFHDSHITRGHCLILITTLQIRNLPVDLRMSRILQRGVDL